MGLRVQYPRLDGRRHHLRFAVNNDYAELDRILQEGDEVAVIPPVAGGEGELVRLTHDCIAAAELVSLVAHAGCGGIVSFEGIVRAEKSTSGSLEALGSVYWRDGSRFGWIGSVLNRSRSSRFTKRRWRPSPGTPGDRRMFRGHRGRRRAWRAAAFEACRHITESIKKDVPIWNCGPGAKPAGPSRRRTGTLIHLVDRAPPDACHST